MSSSPFRSDSPLMRAIGRVGDLVLVNILFLICSIPIVTLGASSAALNTVAFQMVRGEESGVARAFFSAFRKNLLQGVLLTLLFLALGAGLYLDLRVTQANPAAVPFLLRVGAGHVAFFGAITLPYVFVLLAKFENTIGQTLKNAFLLAVTHPLTSIVCALMTLAPVMLLLFATYSLLLSSIFWFLFGFSLIALANAYLIGRVLRPVLPKPESEQES